MKHVNVRILAASAALAFSLALSIPAHAQGAETTYKGKCAACHGADGTAATPMGRAKKIVSFKDPSMIKLTDEQLFASTKNGKGTMPAYAGKLTDPQITDIVAYMRTLQK